MYMSTYRRLLDDIPRVCVQEARQHGDEVLHVSVSHCGHLAATCSKDKTTCVWMITNELTLDLMRAVKLEGAGSMPVDSAQRSFFSRDDSFLAICGALAGDNLMGVVKVYDIEADRFTVEYVCMPSDSYATWISNSDLVVCYGNFDLPRNGALFALYHGDVRRNCPLEQICCILLPQLGFIRQLTAGCNEREQTIRLFYASDGEWNFPYQVGCVEVPLSKPELCDSEDLDDHRPISPVALADMNAFIVGLQITPDGLFILVNCRPVAPGHLTEQLRLEDKVPPASGRMEVRVLRANDLQVVHILQGHVGLSQGMCYYILLDAISCFVARYVKWRSHA